MAVGLAMTGASGVAYGFGVLEQVLSSGEEVYLMFSKAARLVVHSESAWRLPSRPKDIEHYLGEHYQHLPGKLRVFGMEQWSAPVASGSHVPRALVICPCSSGTLAAVANGLNRTLIDRAAEVVLKEQRKLILVHRETPLSTIQLENMLRLARAGAVVMPANPGFYNQPEQISDLIDFMVARILDHLEIAHQLQPRWGE